MLNGVGQPIHYRTDNRGKQTNKQLIQMNKQQFLRGGERLPYSTPEMELVAVDVEQGFALSGEEDDWGNGSIKDDNWNDMGDY